jgi:hypothetical protein
MDNAAFRAQAQYFYQKRNWKEEVQGRGIGAVAARQIADRVDRIPHDTYVEPFLGRGDIFRAVAPSPKMILNDLDCDRVKQAQTSACAMGGRTPSSPSCVKLNGGGATVGCGKDWKELLKHDSPRTLFLLDPPWEGVPKRGHNYPKDDPIGPGEMIARTRGLKGAAAIVYRDAPEVRKVLCRAPFRCHAIRKNFFGRPFTQLLAVKPPARYD